MRPFREAGSPVADAVGPAPYRAVQTMFDAGFPPGRRNYWKSGFLRSLDDDAVAVLVEWFRRSPNPSAGLLVEAPLRAALDPDEPREAVGRHGNLLMLRLSISRAYKNAPRLANTRALLLCSLRAKANIGFSATSASPFWPRGPRNRTDVT